MMFSAKFAGLAALFTTVAATALYAPRQTTDGNLHFCTGPQFSGNCSDIAYTSGECYMFPTGFIDIITSITTQDRVNNENACCYAYQWYDCTGNKLAFFNDGPTDLGPGWDDTFVSVKCNVQDTCPW